MYIRFERLAVVVASAALLGLAGCGGGGGGTTTAPVTTPVENTMASVPVTVIDGAIRNATVCLDKNQNGVCDSGEPSGKTDAAGNVTLQVEIADAGKYPILAIAGTDAVDVDHGPVTVPFTMKAPADKPSVVSPLTTLVQSVVESSGTTSAAAETSIKSQLGVNVSLFDDFTKNTSAAGQNAGTIARMVVVTNQQQSTALASALGTQAIDGKTITQADLNRAIEQKLLEILPALVSTLADPSVTSAATAEAKAAALTALAQALVAAPTTGLTTTSVATMVAINNQALSGTAPPVETPTASVQLRHLRFTDAGNWFTRVFTSTAAQATPDSSDNTRYVERRGLSNGGSVASWNTGASPDRQSDLHWNGSAWVNCGFNSEFLSSVRDAQGNSTYDYCDKFETGRSNRAAFDIAGRTMIEVHNQILGAGFTNISFASATSALGSATYPPGSRLFYLTNTPLTNAVAYYPGNGNIVRNANANVAAGKTSASDTTAACAAITASTPSASYTTAATTLESVIAANPGTPCVFGPGSVTITTVNGTTTVSSGARNEWWSQSTVSVGTIGTATTGGVQTGYYTSNAYVRVAFGSGNTVKYYSCQQRSTDGSPRNCDLIGTSTYTIETLGDGRALRLGTPPALTGGLNYQRVFVERGGKVYFGYENKPTVAKTARLNTAATGALFTQLGLPPVDPSVPLALTRESYVGSWLVSDTADLSSGATIWMSPSGLTSCFETATGANDACTMTFNPATGAFNLIFADGVATGTLNFLSGAVSGTFTPTGESPVSISGSRR